MCEGARFIFGPVHSLEGAGGCGLAPSRPHLLDLDVTTVKVTTTKLNFTMHRTQLGEQNKFDFLKVQEKLYSIKISMKDCTWLEKFGIPRITSQAFVLAFHCLILSDITFDVL